MNTDPWKILGLDADTPDEAIREKYLELVRRCPPEQDPIRFAEIQRAYEFIRHRTRRLKARFFERGPDDTLDHLIEEVACRSPRRRPTLTQLRRLLRPNR
jgi:curved DNA-binding protein CbpA